MADSNDLECCDCGVPVPSPRYDGAYEDGAEIKCDCGVTNRVSVDDESDVYFSSWTCKHGNDGDEPCDLCLKEEALSLAQRYAAYGSCCHSEDCVHEAAHRLGTDLIAANAAIALAAFTEREAIAAWLDEWTPTVGEAIKLVESLRFLYLDPDVNEHTPLHFAPSLSFDNACLLVMSAIRSSHHAQSAQRTEGE